MILYRQIRFLFGYFLCFDFATQKSEPALILLVECLPTQKSVSISRYRRLCANYDVNCPKGDLDSDKSIHKRYPHVSIEDALRK